MDAITRFRQLFDYNRWANRQALASLASVEEARAERPLKLFGHVLGAERVWLARFDAPSPGIQPWPSITPSDAAAAIERLHAQWIALLDRLGPEGLEGELAYRNTQGTEFKTPVRDILTHLVMHSAYHRGQVAAAVRESGGNTAATDYVIWARRGKSA